MIIISRKRSVKSLVLEDSVIAALRESKSLLTTKELAAKCGKFIFTREVICQGNHNLVRGDIVACHPTGEFIRSSVANVMSQSLAIHTINRAVASRDLYPVLTRLVHEKRIIRFVIENNNTIGWLISEHTGDIDLEALWILNTNS